MKTEATDSSTEATPCSFSQRALSELKLELFDLQSRVTTENFLKLLILLCLLGIWATMLFVN